MAQPAKAISTAILFPLRGRTPLSLFFPGEIIAHLPEHSLK
jgi:hypothetical protein